MTAHFPSYAANREDVVLFRALRSVEGGRYIDIGAQDPTQDSTSRAFYDRGWRGITADQVGEWADRQHSERPEDLAFHARIAADDDDSEFPTRRLDDLLTQAGWENEQIHFLSVDTEGTEEGVLRSLDLHIWRPWIVVVDCTLPTEDAYLTWEPILIDAGYSCCLYDGMSRFYVAAEHRDEFQPVLSYPACPLDWFVPVRELNQRRAIRERRREEIALGNEIRRISGELDALGGPIMPRIEAARIESATAVADALGWKHRAVTRWPQSSIGYTGPGSGATAAEVGHLRRNIHHLQLEMARMKRSVSWRVSAPLRVVRRRLGGGS